MKSGLVKAVTGEYAEYLRDESRCIGHADEIAFPCSEEELREVLAEGCRSGTKLTLQGARTGITAAAVPRVGNAQGGRRVLSAGRAGGGAFSAAERA